MGINGKRMELLSLEDVDTIRAAGERVRVVHRPSIHRGRLVQPAHVTRRGWRDVEALVVLDDLQERHRREYARRTD